MTKPQPLARIRRAASRPAATVLLLVALLLAAGGAGAATLSEIRIDQPSTDNDEYFELAGSAGESLAGLTYLVIGDSSGGGSGVIEAVVDLTGQSIPGSGFFVAAEATFGLGVADLITSLNFENSDNVTHLLVDGFVGSNGDDLDTNDDGVLDVTPWATVEDCVALVETVGSGDQVYCATAVGPDGTFVPAHVYFCPGGWEIGPFNPVGGADTPGGPNACSGLATASLSEIRIDQPGTDNDEYFELEGPAGGTLDGLTYLVIGDGAGGSGVVEAVVDLTGSSLGGGGFFVAAEATFSLGVADLTTNLNFENSDNVTHLLVRDFGGALNDDLDTNDDGLLDATPWSELLDCVALVETVGSGDQIYCPTTVGPDGPFVPGHTFFCPQGWQIGPFDPAGGDDTPGAANPCAVPAEASLSEIRIDQPGTDTDEYFELAGTPFGTLDGLTYLVIGDGSGGSGVIEEVTDLAGQIVPASGFFVAAEGTFGLGTANLTTSLSFENSDNVTHLLVSGFTGSNGDDLDTDDDGVLDVEPWSELVDCVALIETVGSGDRTYCATEVGPDGSFVPAHVYLCPEGWQIGAFNPVGGQDTPGGPNLCGAAVINEIDYDQPGTDDAEFIEIANAGGAPIDLGAFSLELVNGSGGGAVVYNTIALPGVTLAPGDYFVVCGNAANVANCDLDVSPDSNLIQNGSPDAVALVAAGAVIDTVSYEGDTGAPYTEGSGSGLEDSPAEDFRGISRVPDGVDTDQNNVDLLGVCITPGRANTPLASGCGAAGPVREIFEIQGSGLASPFDGQTIATEDNAVTAVGPDGFFIQTPTARSDGDPDTSDGIFVFTGGAPAVAVGDRVQVTGNVAEFFGFTELGGFPDILVTGSGAVPAAVAFGAATPSPDPTTPSCSVNNFECFEGMLVEIVGGTVTGPNQRFTPDPVAEVHIVAGPDRAFREPGIEFPGLPGLPLWDGNPEVFELDPDKLGLPNEIIPAGSSFDAVGAIGFEFGGYELWPSSLSFTPAPLPVPVRPREPGEFTVASLNLFRLFDDVDDPADTNFLGETRDDQVVSSAEYARRLAKFASYVVEVLDAPDVLAVQEAEKLGVLADLAAEINLLDPAVVYSAHLVEGNDVGTIDVGFLTRDTIQVDAVTQLGLTETFINPINGATEVLHDRPPLLLEGSCLDAVPFPIQVMGLHQRSLGGIDGPEGLRVRQKRFEQAQSVAQKVQDLQTANPEARLVVTGDFNAFEFTDGYVDVVGQIQGDFTPADNLVCDTNLCDDLVDPDLANVVLGLPAGERYSFIFRGSAQVLDHALTSRGLALWLRGFEYGRGNADAAFDLINDDSTLLRSSDHDGLVLYVMKDSDGDGVANDLDVCPGTVIPEGVPTQRLGVNRWALTDDDGIFDTMLPPGHGAPAGGPGAGMPLFEPFTIEQTAGCSCEQIIDALDLGQGHVKFGCSRGAMEDWIEMVNP